MCVLLRIGLSKEQQTIVTSNERSQKFCEERRSIEFAETREEKLTSRRFQGVVSLRSLPQTSTKCTKLVAAQNKGISLVYKEPSLRCVQFRMRRCSFISVLPGCARNTSVCSFTQTKISVTDSDCKRQDTIFGLAFRSCLLQLQRRFVCSMWEHWYWQKSDTSHSRSCLLTSTPVWLHVTQKLTTSCNLKDALVAHRGKTFCNFCFATEILGVDTPLFDYKCVKQIVTADAFGTRLLIRQWIQKERFWPLWLRCRPFCRGGGICLSADQMLVLLFIISFTDWGDSQMMHSLSLGSDEAVRALSRSAEWCSLQKGPTEENPFWSTKSNHLKEFTLHG